MAKVVIKAGRNIGAEYKLTSERLILGRRSACPIPVADSKASREHAAINQRNGAFYVQDLSRNGTLLNGKPCDKNEPGTLMKFGDQIRIGDTVIELVDQTAEPIEIEIPGYTILEKVGTGGMGIVYKARQLSMDRVVALKVLNDRYSANPEFQDRFIREARAAGRLNHPNVIHVHDISRVNGRHYFSMEFIDGSSVKDVLKIERKMEVNKALDIVLQASKALEFAHENRIVHRDIKPDNIMLTREGIVKIADLGIAKTFEDVAPSAKEQRRIMGTPHYMAPEQALGKAIDHRVDIYSLGATFYHMVTGSTPFTGSTAHEVLKAHIQESLPPIQDLNANVPDPVCFIVERMMAKLPEKRYPDMSKVIEDIERVQRGVIAGIHRIEAGDSTIMRAMRAKSQKKAAVDAAAAAGAAEVKAEGDDPDEIPEDVATGAQSPVSIGKMALIAALVFAAGVAIVLVFFRNPNQQVVEIPHTVTSVATATSTSTAATTGVSTESAAEAEAQKLLDDAKAAKTANNLDDCKAKCEQLKSKYGATKVAAEADKLLKDVVAEKAQRDKDEVVTLMAKAKEFDAANAGKYDDVLAKYKEVAEKAAVINIPDIREAASARMTALQAQRSEEFTREMEAAYKQATGDVQSATAKFDYDAARKVLSDFIAAHPKAKQVDDAKNALDQVNAAAKTRLDETQKLATAAEIPDALKIWEEYGQEVKDAAAADAAKQGADAANKRAEDLTTLETEKANKEGRAYQFGNAIEISQSLAKKVRNTKFADVAQSRKDSFVLISKLHENALKSGEEKLKKDGPQPADYYESKIGNYKWQVSGINGDVVTFKPVGQGGEMPVKLPVLPPEQQYQFFKQFQPDDHKGLLELCKLLSLDKDAQAEQDSASKAPATPVKSTNEEPIRH